MWYEICYKWLLLKCIKILFAIITSSSEQRVGQNIFEDNSIWCSSPSQVTLPSDPDDQKREIKMQHMKGNRSKGGAKRTTVFGSFPLILRSQSIHTWRTVVNDTLRVEWWSLAENFPHHFPFSHGNDDICAVGLGKPVAPCCSTSSYLIIVTGATGAARVNFFCPV